MYRDINLGFEDVLLDTFNSALSILSRGKIYPENYQYFLEGIKKVNNHIFNKKLTAENAVIYASDVMMISSGLLANIDVFKSEVPNANLFNDKIFKNINFVKKMSIEAFNKAAFAISIIKKI